jgi:uncharacterized protein YlaI
MMVVVGDQRAEGLCRRCGRAPRKGQLIYCALCDERRRLEQYGTCSEMVGGQPCGKPVWSRGVCHTCSSRIARQNERLRSYFTGNPASFDDFVRVMQRLIDLLVAPLLRSHDLWASFIETDAYSTHPDVVQILTVLRATDVLPEPQYRYILRRANDQLAGICRVTVPYTRAQGVDHAEQGTQ